MDESTSIIKTGSNLQQLHLGENAKGLSSLRLPGFPREIKLSGHPDDRVCYVQIFTRPAAPTPGYADRFIHHYLYHSAGDAR